MEAVQQNEVYVTQMPSPIGMLTLAADDASITGIWIEGQRYFAAGLSRTAIFHMNAPLAEAQRWLSDYFSGKDPGALPSLKPAGTSFQQRVWQQLLQIPYGKTVSYGDIAKLVGCKSARAVGQAVGRNPISILIPCHRVIGKHGSPTGYACGLSAKAWLLSLEQQSE